MSSHEVAPVLQMIFAIFMVGLGILPIIAVIWLFAWMKDIREDNREIRAVLKKHFPADFDDE
jgi:hypothetical protein